MVWTANFFVRPDFHQDTLLFNIVFTIYLILVSGFIEINRPGGDFFSFGLHFDKTTLHNIVVVFLIVASFFVIITLVTIFFFELRLGEFNIVIATTLLMHLFVSMSEEILVRGIIFQALAEKFGYVISAIVTSVIFSLMHYFNPNIDWLSFFNIVIAGLLFSLMLVKTGSLWMPITFHFFWNAGFHAVFGLKLSGIPAKNSIIYLESIPQNLFWGYEFGLEGGLITTFSLIICGIITLKYAKLSPYVTSKIFKRRYIESKTKYEI